MFTKTCNKCGKSLPLTEFYKRSAAKDGLTTACKACIYTPNGTGKGGRPSPCVEPGQKFAKLTAIKRVENDRYGHTCWLWLCDCGKQVVIDASQVKRGKRTTCGCSSIKKASTNLNVLIKDYRIGAQRRGYIWELTVAQAKSLFFGNCFYCGAPPSRIKNVNDTTDLVFNGIDRLDSSSGYTTDNCVSCCTKCNYMKGILTFDEFRQQVGEIYNNLILNKKQNGDKL